MNEVKAFISLLTVTPFVTCLSTVAAEQIMEGILQKYLCPACGVRGSPVTAALDSVSPWVIGGVEARLHSYPWVAQVGRT